MQIFSTFFCCRYGDLCESTKHTVHIEGKTRGIYYGLKEYLNLNFAISKNEPES
jgi:hypothetical protein